MFRNGRKTICVIICDVAEEYSKNVCRIVSSEALSRNINVAFFSLFSLYGDNTRSGQGEANIVHLIPYERFDGFLLCLDTFQNQKACDMVRHYIKERTNAPIITLRREEEGVPCVRPSNLYGIRQMVDHLVTHHHFTKFAFMGGPKEHPDAIHRLDEYKSTLQSHHIPFNEKSVFYGDFWSTYAKDAANYFMYELEERPEVIVCANDYMAIALNTALINLGFMIPNDVAVTGFDDIFSAGMNMPPLTTVQVPVEDMVIKAMDLLEDQQKGIEVPMLTEIPLKLKVRNSCGCTTCDFFSIFESYANERKKQTQLTEFIRTNNYMFSELSSVNNAFEIIHHVRILDSPDYHIRHLFITLGEGKGANYPKYSSAKPGYPKESRAIGSFVNHQIISTETFETQELLPPEVELDEPQIFYFFPLHSLNENLGYIAVSFEGEETCPTSFYGWIGTLATFFVNLRLQIKSNLLLEELSDLYIKDVLTGLYNRRGYENAAKDLYYKSLLSKETLIVISMDMDHLKIVNDRFGHLQGDMALQTISKAINKAASPEDICARMGGDEFSVVGIGYDEESAEKWVKTFLDYLDDFNERSDLPYLVSASIGYYIIPADHSVSLSDATIRSDQCLYQNKNKKKQEKGSGFIVREKTD